MNEVLLSRLQENSSLAAHGCCIELRLQQTWLSMSCPEKLSEAVFIEPHSPVVQSLLEDKAGDRNKRGHGVHIAATAGPLPHHQPSMSGTPPQEGSSTLEPDVLGKCASSSRSVGMLNSMSARE